MRTFLSAAWHRPWLRPWLATRRQRSIALLAAVVILLAGVHLILRFGPMLAGVVAAPVVALLLIVLARRAGLSWDELGLARRSLRRGAAYTLLLVAVVAAGYAVTLFVPFGKAVLTAVSLQLESSGSAWLAMLVLVPLGTVLIEEIAFRGVLLGLLQRHRGAVVSSLLSSALFAAWHVLPSLRQESTTVEWTIVPPLAFVGIAVAFTCLAGLVLCEIRRRSGSLLASAGLHWAVNGLGILLLTQLS